MRSRGFLQPAPLTRERTAGCRRSPRAKQLPRLAPLGKSSAVAIGFARGAVARAAAWRGGFKRSRGCAPCNQGTGRLHRRRTALPAASSSLRTSPRLPQLQPSPRRERDGRVSLPPGSSSALTGDRASRYFRTGAARAFSYHSPRPALLFPACSFCGASWEKESSRSRRRSSTRTPTSLRSSAS